MGEEEEEASPHLKEAQVRLVSKHLQKEKE